MFEERINDDLKEALRAKDALRLSTLRMVKAGIKNLAIDKRVEKLDDKDVIAVLSKQIKQHKDSIEGFMKGNRQDLVDKEKAELAILESYMPRQLSSDELRVIVKASILSIGASGKADMGKVMKKAMEEAAGAADGGVLSRIVSEELAKIG